MITSLVGLSLLGFGCKGEVGPAGPSLSGALTGKVTLYAADGSREYDDSGVSVWIEGSADTSLTDSLGRWSIGGVSTGTYSVVMRKTGYGFMKIPSVQFVGGGTYYLGEKRLAAEPPLTPNLYSYRIVASPPSVAVGGGVPGALTSQSVLIYVGRQGFNRFDPLTYIDTLMYDLSASIGFFTEDIPVREVPWNFSTGDTIWFHAYLVSGKLDGYSDPASGGMVFSTGASAEGDSARHVSP